MAAFFEIKTYPNNEKVILNANNVLSVNSKLVVEAGGGKGPCVSVIHMTDKSIFQTEQTLESVFDSLLIASEPSGS